jgi:4-pyridoxate dehydrogenase
MGYVRGHRADYDRWASQGLPGWSYKEVLPYFKQSETWEDGESTYRGGNVPIYVRRTKEMDPVYAAYMDAGSRAGHPITEDYNGSQQHGFGIVQWTIRNGRRDSAARGYLHPVLRRRNLVVHSCALAERIVLERGRAVAVAFRRDRQSHTARAAREVIVSAGAINSPQLLMLSGIGDPDHLRELGIAVSVPRAGVGRNLQDHYSTGLAHERREAGPFVAATRFDRLAVSCLRAMVAGTGPATEVPSGFMAFVKTDPALPVPDVQFLFRCGPPDAGPWFPGIKPAWRDAFMCRPVLLRPASRGSIKLRSANPADPVRIHQNFLSDARDLPVLRAGLKMLREIAAQPPLDRFRGREIGPGEGVRSDTELDDYIRTQAHHPCGTCTMGTDENAVVDPTLRVYGVDGLRVVDACSCKEPTLRHSVDHRVGDAAATAMAHAHWIKSKNPNAPAVKREAEEEWGQWPARSRRRSSR